MSVADIAKELGFRSINAAEEHLKDHRRGPRVEVRVGRAFNHQEAPARQQPYSKELLHVEARLGGKPSLGSMVA